jgi:hypothetical protein
MLRALLSSARSPGYRLLLGSALVLGAVVASCGEDAANDDDDDDDVAAGGGGTAPYCEPTTTFLPPTEPAERPALFITSEALRGSFARYCALHDVTGIPTRLATVEEICTGTCDDADARNDTAHGIKQFILQQPGVRYVVLGGDIEIVPSRRVRDSYENPFSSGYTFDEIFHTDYYYSDWSLWDTNGDGVYASDGTDYPDLLPEVPVARIPVSSPEEAERYLQKVIRYLTAFPAADVPKALALSNVATEFLGFDIDGAHYLEAEGRTLSLLPAGFTVRRLYATNTVEPSAEIITPQGQIAAIEQGTNLVVHSGHSAVPWLTVELDGSKQLTGQMVFGLQNATLPIFLSCGCEAGAFAAPYGPYAEDAAGEMLLNAPVGGAIAYLGNSVIGLGLAGGMQLIDELLRYVQSVEAPLLADAYQHAHQHLPQQDTFNVPIVGVPVPVVDQDSYEWTQKAVVLFGDPLIPVYKQPLAPAPAVALSAEPLCDGVRLTVSLGPEGPGLLRLHADGLLYEVPNASGVITVDIPGAPPFVAAGFTLPGHQPGYAELLF